MSEKNLYIELYLDKSQITEALKNGLLKKPASYIELNVSDDVIPLLDSSRLVVRSDGRIEIFDRINDRNGNITLKEFGELTDIKYNLVDYIVKNRKTVFDVDCLKKLYELQDQAIENYKKRIENEKRMIEEKKKARELLSSEFKEMERRINELYRNNESLQNRIKELEKEIGELREKYKTLVKFINEKNLVNDFINWIKEVEEEEVEKKIIERFELEDIED